MVAQNDYNNEKFVVSKSLKQNFWVPSLSFNVSHL